jgi:hypothetical protein
MNTASCLEHITEENLKKYTILKSATQNDHGMQTRSKRRYKSIEGDEEAIGLVIFSSELFYPMFPLPPSLPPSPFLLPPSPLITDRKCDKRLPRQGSSKTLC